MSRFGQSILAALVVLAASGVFAADIYRCAEGGKVEYSDRPCKGGTANAVVPTPSDRRPGGTRPGDEPLPQHQTFTHDGFEWKVISARTFRVLGSDTNPQRPANNTFVVVELELKNVSDKPRYHGSTKLLGNGTQYSPSHTAYAKHQMGYGDNESTKFEPGVTMKTFVAFDAGITNEYVLLIESWMGDARAKVRVIPTVGRSAGDNAARAAPSATPPSRPDPDAQERAAKAGERRFVRYGDPSANLGARLGSPDSKEYQDGGECWIYGPTPNDAQTRTRICFKRGVVYDVQRTVQR